MTISGMKNERVKLRNQSKNNASRYSRRSRAVKKNNKKSKKKKRIENNKKRVYIGLAVFLALLIVLVALNNWRIFQDYIEALDINNNVLSEVIPEEPNSDGLERMILVTTKYDQNNAVNVDKVYSLTNNREKGIRSITYIPGGVYIPLGYRIFSDSASVANLYYAGETISTDIGRSYAIWEIENFLGYEFDSYLWLDPEATEEYEKSADIKEDVSSEQYLNKLVKISNPINILLKRDSLTAVSSYVHSNLNPTDILDLLSQYGFSAFDEVTYIDFSLPEYVDQKLVASGEEESVLNANSVDKEIRVVAQEILSKDLEREQSKIEVYNGSDISGLASRFSRKVVNNGLNVVRIDNTDRRFEETTIFVPIEEEYSNTVQLLVGLMPFEPKIVNSRPSFLTTADVVVIFGQDMREDVEWLPQL